MKRSVSVIVRTKMFFFFFNTQGPTKLIHDLVLYVLTLVTRFQRMAFDTVYIFLRAWDWLLTYFPALPLATCFPRFSPFAYLFQTM